MALNSEATNESISFDNHFHHKSKTMNGIVKPRSPRKRLEPQRAKQIQLKKNLLEIEKENSFREISSFVFDPNEDTSELLPPDSSFYFGSTENNLVEHEPNQENSNSISFDCNASELSFPTDLQSKEFFSSNHLNESMLKRTKRKKDQAFSNYVDNSLNQTAIRPNFKEPELALPSQHLSPKSTTESFEEKNSTCSFQDHHNLKSTRKIEETHADASNNDDFNDLKEKKKIKSFSKRKIKFDDSKFNDLRRKNRDLWEEKEKQEREKIKEFWLGLTDNERRELVKLEKEAVLKKMKEQQKHTCSCSVCGRRRSVIEKELENLYDAYYEELESYKEGTQKKKEQEKQENTEDGDFNFGKSLTVKGGILTVADDMLKNEGKKFLEMMEKLAE